MAADDRSWQIAVDTGGTFTDAYALAPGGHFRRAKLLSSARLRARVVSVTSSGDAKLIQIDRDFGAGEGLFEGFEVEGGGARATAGGWCAAERLLTVPARFVTNPGQPIDLFTGEEVPVLAARLLTGTALGRPFPQIALRVATTRGTNALLEGKGTPPLMVLPSGMGDLLEIGDQRRPQLFALQHHKHRLPLAAVIEAQGRLDREGEVIEPFAADILRDALRNRGKSGAGCAAVALLHSYRNDSHEREAVAVLARAGYEHISASAELSTSMRLLPRAQTAAADAYLAPVMNQFVAAVRERIGTEFLMMTSAGGLEPSAQFRPKDSLLSGPAGGLVGALEAATAAGIDQVLTFDMGGTSTDVARIGDGTLPHVFEQQIGGATVLGPSLHIETVAAGGGSICTLKPEGLAVGPESAGADPGPACYGRGGPLTLTDVNLLLGRIEPEHASIPLEPQASRVAFAALCDELSASGLAPRDEQTLLRGLLQIAVERMADAIRKISVREGYDPSAHTLVAFGGAGPQHACAVADALGITRVLVPGDAGLLSARGVAAARVERFAEAVVLQPLERIAPQLPARIAGLEENALASLGCPGEVHRRIAELRLAGQEAPLEFEIADPNLLAEQFAERFATLFGYPPPPDRSVELVSLRVGAATPAPPPARIAFGDPEPIGDTHIESTPFFTLVAEPDWALRRSFDGSALLERQGVRRPEGYRAAGKLALDLTRYRLGSIVEEMGAVLKRCAISTNVREREDYSCALLDGDGQLAINAPHIPVHLGALGLCVRRVAAEIELQPGDIAVTNHPGFGGSHLPDITVIAAAFDRDGGRIGYLANRAHHAEIGGIAPGSMPPDAGSLAEEGVVITPRLLYRGGQARFGPVQALLERDPFPTRNLADNLADLQAQAAALRSAVRSVETLDADQVRPAMSALLERSAELCRERIAGLPFARRSALERLDCGAELHVALTRHGDTLRVDFSGSSPTLPHNLNATPAIVRSAVLYVLRLLLAEDLPLNEGLLSPVSIVLPECLLNPSFDHDPERCPPVVGGNVETSQRLVDTLIKALGLQACSQGTMNNLLFGDDRFGYYETIAGGAGAGAGYDGASALHTHMTNTAITDPEVLEWRYPVRLRRFAIRRGSGGTGSHRGGDGVIREFEFLRALTLSVLAEHRRTAPFGIEGGADGAAGAQYLIPAEGGRRPLPGRFTGVIDPGSVVRIETPGGGGFGSPQADRT